MPMISCPACGASEYRVYGTRGRNRIVVCRGCTLFYVNPVPDREELDAGVKGSSAYTKDQERKVDFFRARAERLFDAVERHTAPGRVLDIGCAIGTELDVARERGWEGVGLELSLSSVQVARERGLDVRQQTLEESELPAGHFDLVTMNHVLEHIAYMDDFLSEVTRILVKKGLFYIAVPNVNAWRRFLRGKRYHWTFQDDHFFHFSPRTLKRLLEKHGFTILELSTSRWVDFCDDLSSHSMLFRGINRVVEKLEKAIEIICLARVR